MGSRLTNNVEYFLNGSMVTRSLDSGVLRGLTQEQEGTYACKYDGQFSNNITLAGIITPYTFVLNTFMSSMN